MNETTINNIKKMFNDRIDELKAQNEKLRETLDVLTDMESSDNIHNAIEAIEAECMLNNTFIDEYAERLNDIKEMLNDYNECKSRINSLRAQNKHLSDIISLNDMETSYNICKAKGAIEAEIELNNKYIAEYTSVLNDYAVAIERLYDENRD